MRRREAVQLFKLICECMPEAFISGISLSPIARSKEEFELRINLVSDPKYIKNVETLVAQNGLMFKESQGSLLIYGSKAKSNKMSIIT